MNNKSVLIILPPLGGGTTRHAKEMAKAWSGQGFNVLFVEFKERLLDIKLYYNQNIVTSLKYWDENPYENLSIICKLINVKVIHIHHTLGANGNFYDFILKIGIPYVFTLHDYYAICPSIKLINEKEIYCEENSLECEKCYNMRFYSKNKSYSNIHEWRKFNYNFLLQAKCVIVPSNDVKLRIIKYFKDLNIKVIPNSEILYNGNKFKNIKINENKNLKIGLIGSLTVSKGSNCLIECANYITKNNIPIDFVVFGTLNKRKFQRIPRNIKILGKYKEEEIFSLILTENVDFCWFPAQWPETYSYVLTIPALLKIPVLGSNLGAISERIQHNNWGEIYQWDADTKLIVDKMLNFDFVKYKNLMKNYKVENDEFPRIEEFYDFIELNDLNDEICKEDLNSQLLNIKILSEVNKTKLRDLSLFEYSNLILDDSDILYRIKLFIYIRKSCILSYFLRKISNFL